MKKYILAVAVLLSGVVVSSAGDRVVGSPRYNNGDPAFNADYAGMDISTAAFTANNTLAFSGEGVVTGVIISTPVLASDYIIFRDTQSVLTTESTDEIFRVYAGTNAVVNNGVQNLLVKLPYPIRVKRGLAYKANVATFNMITVLYNKFGN